MGVIFGSLIAGVLGVVILFIAAKKAPVVSATFPVLDTDNLEVPSDKSLGE